MHPPKYIHTSNYEFGKLYGATEVAFLMLLLNSKIEYSLDKIYLTNVKIFELFTKHILTNISLHIKFIKYLTKGCPTNKYN